MSLTAAAIRTMAEKGLSAFDIAEIAEAMAVRSDPTAAERKRRQRERDRSHCDVTRDPPIDISSYPPELVSEAKASSTKRTVKKSFFVRPDGVDPQHWADFMANRKRKRLPDTQSAFEGQMKDLARIADDEWPPGRLVQHAAAKGWGSINDPRQAMNGNGNGRRNGIDPMGGNRGTQSRTLAAGAAFVSASG